MRVLLILLNLTFIGCAAVQAQARETFQLYKESKIFLENRQYARARDLLDTVIREQPDLIEAYYDRGTAKMQLGDQPGAHTDFSIYLELNPDNSEALFARSILDLNLQHFQSAVEGFRRLMVLPPGETRAIYFQVPVDGSGTRDILTIQSKDNNRSLLFNYLGLAESGLNHCEKSIAYYDSAINILPGNSDYYLNRGVTYDKCGQEEKARQDFKAALGIDPQNALANYNLALSYEKSGDKDALDSLLGKSIEDNPEAPTTYKQRGYQRLLTGSFEPALADLDKALTLDPGDAMTLLNRGIILEKMGRLEDALLSYTQAIKFKPDFEKAYYNRGNVLYKLNELQHALNDYTMALLYDKEYGRAFYQRGIVYLKLGEKQKACDNLEAASNLHLEMAIMVRDKYCHEPLK